MLLSHCSGGPLLGGSSSDSGFLGGNSRFGSVFGVEESPVELSVLPETTWAVRMEGPKLVTFLHFPSSLL